MAEAGLIAWADLKPPTIDEFAEIAKAAIEALPEPFRGLVLDVPCRIEDFASDEILEEMDMDSPFDLMGLFQGVGLPQGGAEPFSGQMPNQISLYRRPILDYWAESDETLGEIITHVVIHEIGHHFGFSDEDMEAIEAQD